mmetsp:Transcript_75973/g.152644  ORF Transcript_75973/g.152644 Transcript_75973/m.152644 type:complete len:137 (+) Transcript_75973:52-462(+)
MIGSDDNNGGRPDMKTMTQAQDDILEDLNKGLDKQKKAGEQMGSEIRRQQDVLENDLDGNVDKAMDQLMLATKRANAMRKESGFIWMYFCNLVLFLLFFILLWIGLSSGLPNKCPSSNPSPSPPSPTAAPAVAPAP